MIQNPDQRDFTGNTEDTPLTSASSRLDLNIKQDGNDDTRDVGNFEGGDFPALTPNYDGRALAHHTFLSAVLARRPRRCAATVFFRNIFAPCVSDYHCEKKLKRLKIGKICFETRFLTAKLFRKLYLSFVCDNIVKKFSKLSNYRHTQDCVKAGSCICGKNSATIIADFPLK